jgi:hypothetical protein
VDDAIEQRPFLPQSETIRLKKNDSNRIIFWTADSVQW